MQDVLGNGTILGYCTNVHSGTSVLEVQQQLNTHALSVKKRISPDAPMGIGLWFSAQAADELLADPHTLAAFRDWLIENGLLAYTLNGFPYGDFHQDRVKHAVYKPDWRSADRMAYTASLVAILGSLLPDEAEGSISTVPLGWPDAISSDIDRKMASEQLTDLVHQLARVELDTGKYIHIDLEPEPGCALQRAGDVTTFFRDHLLGTLDDESVRGYLRICHDVCHSAVMFEEQEAALKAYRSLNLKVGKVQISSAVAVDFDALPPTDRTAALDQLASFCEDRYLHQTCIRTDDGAVTFHEDLPDAIATTRNAGGPHGEWRVHFHVPVYLDQFDRLGTTQNEIAAFFAAMRESDKVNHFEVETYAWNVLPEALQRQTLAEGIADELAWVRETFGEASP